MERLETIDERTRIILIKLLAIEKMLKSVTVID